MATRSVTEGLTLANAIMTARASDQRLAAPERAQIQENLQRGAAALADVNPNTQLVPPNRRQAHESALKDRVRATIQISNLHGELVPAEFYDGLDLYWDCADAIVAGQPTIASTLSDGL